MKKIKTLKTAFFGTSDKSIPIIETLNKNTNLTLCVTKADTLVGRKKFKRETQVKKWAKENNTTLIEISKLNLEKKKEIANAIHFLYIDLVIVADFNYIIPTTLLSTPNYGMLNIHFSSLPKYRGASPVQHTILNSENFAGITYMLMNKGMDTGDIIWQSSHELNHTEYTGPLYHTLFNEAAINLPKVINNYINKKYIPQKQNHKNATYCYSSEYPKSTYIYKQDAEITINDNMRQIYNKIRAFNPWPVAWLTCESMSNIFVLTNADNFEYKFKDNKLKIPKKSKVLLQKEKNILANAENDLFELSRVKFKPNIAKDTTIKIYSANLVVYKNSNEIKGLVIDEIQLQNKNKINFNDFFNGYLDLKL